MEELIAQFQAEEWTIGGWTKNEWIILVWFGLI
jgi:hypothetical protein